MAVRTEKAHYNPIIEILSFFLTDAYLALMSVPCTSPGL